MNTIAYRQLRATDVGAIARVHHRACRIAYAFMNWSYSERAVRDWYAGEIAGWDWGMVAETKSEIVGFVAMAGNHLDQLFVEPDHQRHGIGAALLTAAIARMPPLVTLIVFEANAPARRFYEHNGFHPAGAFFNEAEQAMELVYRRDGKAG